MECGFLIDKKILFEKIIRKNFFLYFSYSSEKPVFSSLIVELFFSRFLQLFSYSFVQIRIAIKLATNG